MRTNFFDSVIRYVQAQPLYSNINDCTCTLEWSLFVHSRGIKRAPFKCYYSGSLLNTAQLKRRLGEHKMSVPRGTSAVPKRAHYRVKSQPLRGHPHRGRFIKYGHLRTREGCPQSSTFYYSSMFCDRSPLLIPNYKL